MSGGVKEASAEYRLGELLDTCPVGYKRTEVGVIPDDWNVSTIGENTRWSSGGTPNREREEYWGGDIPWISGSTLKTLEISTSDQFLTPEGVATGSKMAPVNATLLLVRGSALHKQIRVGLVVSPVSFNQDVKSLMPCDSVLPKYLTFFMKGMENELLKLVSSAGNSAGVLDTELVKRFKFLKPNMVEQTAIANALSDVDALITSLEALITKKHAIKTAAMQQLLTGKKRLPPFDKIHTGYKQTELGEIPEDWGVGELSSVCTMKSGDGVTSADLDDSAKYPCFGGNGLRGRVDRFTHDGNYALIGRQGALCGNVVRVSGAFFASEHAIVVTPFLQTNIDWLAYVLRRMNLNQYSESSAQPGLSVSKLLRFSLAVPMKAEQDAIADVISSMDGDIAALEQRLTKTQHLKQGMMQELLTGKTRLI